jgi:Ser/Thr protein kinase RdoA (MazF antagonist)
MAKQLGVFLGAFHLRGARFRKTLVGRRKFYDLPFALVGGMMKHVVRQKNKKLKTIVEEVRDGVLRTRPPRGLPRGPIHVDIKPENELWKDEKLSAVLDFGNFYVDAYMIDVGKTIMWNCLREGKLSRALVRAFLKGYESKRRLTTKEREYLPRSVLFAIYSHIFVDLYHVPLGYVPESYTLSLVQDFLPVARTLEREAL